MRASALLTVVLLSTTAFADAYEYDAAGRLAKVTYDDGTWESFTYDAAGNITARAASGKPDPVTPTPDGGASQSDAGTPEPMNKPPLKPCGCSTGAGPLALVLALALRRARRRA